MKIVIYTTFYPSIIQYFDDFVEFINSQTFKNFKLFICLNGCKLSKKKLSKINVEFELFHVRDTWQNARIKAIKEYLREILNFYILQMEMTNLIIRDYKNNTFF